MLAGRMKLKYFVALVAAFSITVIVLLARACKSSEPPPAPHDLVTTPPAPSPTPAPPPAHPGAELAARPYDADEIGRAHV